MSDHPQPRRTLSGNTVPGDGADPHSAESSTTPSSRSPLSVATSFANNSHAGGASSGFAFPAAKPFTPSKPAPPTLLSLPTFSPNQTPAETPLGSPEAELEKLNLGVERYARAIEDPGIGGSFLGTVPLPSFAPAHNQANKRRPSLMDPLSGTAGAGPHASGAATTTTDSSGLNLNSIKRAITGRRRGPETGDDLESYTRGGGEITDMDVVAPVKEKSESHVVNFDLDTKEHPAADTEAVRRRKPKGGILSQLLKLQRNEAAAASSSSKGSHSPSREDRTSSGQHASVKKTKKGFYYRSSSRNSSMTSLKDLSASVSTTPRTSPRGSRIFDQDRSTEDETTLTATTTSRKKSRKSGLRSIRAIRQGNDDDNRSIHHDIAEILTRQSFLIMMAKALILYGAPSHRIEETCLQLAKKMDIDASFSLMPGHMTISFSDPDTHTSDTRHLRCTQGMDMHKLSCVYTIALGVLRGESIESANKELERVAEEPGCFPLWLQVLAWMGSSACVAPLAFNGSWIDTALAGFCGLLVGILGMVAAKFPIYGPLFEMTSSIVVGFIARALGDHVCFSAVALAGVVVLLPGLVLTQAIMELASRNIVSGAVRMFYALMYAFFLGFGLSLGAELWVYLSGDNAAASEQACAHGINHFWYFLIYPAVSASINIVFNAHPRQWFGMTLVTAVGFVVTYFLQGGPQVTSAIAAFAVGITGQLYGRLTGQLSYVPMLSGVLLLVPGSVGVKGILAIIGSDPAKGFTFVLAMINSSSAITLGVFCSALVWYPFWRRSTFMNF